MTITTTWLPEFQVNTTAAGIQSDADVAALAGGGFVIVWTDASGATPRVLARTFDAEGRATSGEILVNQGSGSSLPDVAALPNGGFVVALFEDPGQWRLISFVEDGTPVDQELVSSNLADDPDVIVDGNTVLTAGAVFGNGLDARVDFSTVDQNGNLSFQAFATANQTTAGNQEDVDVAALTGGDYAVVWRDGSAVELQVVNGTGSGTIGSDVSVVATTSVFANPEVIALANGGMVVSYARENNASFPASGFDAYARIYGPDGTPFGSELFLNTSVTVDQAYPVLTPLADGGFAAFWSDFAGVRTIKGQLFDAFGGRRGGEFTVAEKMDADQDVVDADTLSDGRIVLTFGADDFDADGDGIAAIILDPRGGRVEGGGDGDTLYGGQFDDEILGFGGNDTLNGQSGDDRQFGSTGNDVLNGDRGDDALFGQRGGDVLRGGEGDDLLAGGAGGDQLFGGVGIDTASYAASFTAVQIALFNNTASGGPANGDQLSSIENVIGTQFDDTIAGDAGANRLDGLGGADSLNGGNGEDVLSGNGGNDMLEGGGGADELFGGGGSDTAVYQSSTSGVTVALFDGTAQGGHATGDTFASIENIVGSNRNDNLSGDGGANRLQGRFGSDTLNGGNGNDALGGEGGNDTLIGGRGNDDLFGGSGNDRFVFANGDQQDRIFDFADNVDTIVLNRNFGLDGLSAQQVVNAFASVVGSNAVFDFGGGDILTVGGVTNTQLLVNDIDFI